MVHLKVKGEMTELPGEPGVYAVYNAAGELQYIGLSRKVGLG
jgi:excinuclease UvrABC nuclease subunit